MVGRLQRRVGIVGAGVSGVITAAHLLAAGLDVTVFERAGRAGGVWVYDERPSQEPRYPSILASEGDRVWSVEELKVGKSVNNASREFDAEMLEFAPPGPCYAGLMNNVSTPLLRLSLNPWKPGTEDFVKHHVLEQYIQDTSRKTGVEGVTLYDTRVERVVKEDGRWRVRTTTLLHDQGSESRDWEFDAFVVASGHYHAGRVPDIPGLSDWKKSWPTRIQHSKSYRSPESFRGQNVLLVGAGTSSTDIARELGPVANKIFQVSRGGAFDLPTAFLPPNAERIGEIASFGNPPKQRNTLHADEILPSTVFLKDGRRLDDIHRIIVCTGYQFCHPFLLDYHDDLSSAKNASETVLVTDGSQVHNLHKDIFYIPDPTLAFVGIPFYTATFSCFEFQAKAVSAVFGGRAALPSEREMREEYLKRIRRKGVGRLFHSLRDGEVEYVDELVGWLNNEAARQGLQRIHGHTEEWHTAYGARVAKMNSRFKTVEVERIEKSHEWMRV